MLVDYGVKRSLLRALAARGLEITVLPHDATAADVAGHRPDLVVLSPGTGRSFPHGTADRDRGGAGGRGAGRWAADPGHLPRPSAAGAGGGGGDRRLAVGHHGGNHAVIETATGRVDIGAHNHEVAVLDAPELAAAGYRVSHRDLNDGTVEGWPTHRAGLHRSSSTPRGRPDRSMPQPRVRPGRRRRHLEAGVTAPRRVLVIGSGPIVIGQAAEFDYAGVQACLALRGEGVDTILVNSNPATVMTDPDVGGTVLIGPLSVATWSG